MKRYNRSVIKRIWIRIFAVIMIIMGGGGQLWGSIPPGRAVHEVEIPPQVMRIDFGKGDEAGIQDARLIRVETPKTMRIGDEEKIELEFLPVIQREAHLYQDYLGNDAVGNYNEVVEARLELVDAHINGPNPVQESLPSGDTIRIGWEVKPFKEGDHQGRIWLSLRFIPLDGNEPVQQPIFVQDIDIRATSLFGMSGPMARIAGGGVWIAGVFLFVMDLMRGRRMGRNTQQVINQEVNEFR